MKKALYFSALAGFSLFLASCSVSTSQLAKDLGTIGELTGVISSKTNESIQKASDKSIEAETTAFTLEEQYYIGRGITASILSYYPLLENEEATAYVNNITNAMVYGYRANDVFNGYHTAILDSDELNAFATPGGHILVTKGLVKAAGSEDALAAVLAHELGHIQNEHSIRSIREDRKKDANKAVIKAGARTFFETSDLDTVTVDIIDGLSEIDNPEDYEAIKKIKTKLRELESSLEGMLSSSMDTLINSGYSQAFEFEADETALEILSDSGYNVYAMKEMLEVLQKNTTAGSTGFGKTHPKPELRLKKLSDKYNRYEQYPTESVRTKRYLKIIENL